MPWAVHSPADATSEFPTRDFECSAIPWQFELNRVERRLRNGSAVDTSASPLPSERVLRWTFKRDESSLVCELSLTSNQTAYQLRVDPPWNPTGVAVELFIDALSAFHRHAAIERRLLDRGWTLEAFESNHATPH